jgi:hypothetical protein
MTHRASPGKFREGNLLFKLENRLHPADYCTDVRRVAQTVLPNTKNPDSFSSEKPPRSLITLSITIDLCLPELRPGFGNVAASGAPVPKTSVDEDSNSLPLKVKVGFSTDRCRVKHPALDPGPDKCHLKGKLCRFVTLAANCRHGSRALRRHIRKPAVFKFGFQEAFHLRNLREGKRR